MIDPLKAIEERKRERQWDPLHRWQALQETIAWADAQCAVQRNTRAACLRIERCRRHAVSPVWTEQP